jgi:predicted nuclease with TOPRIM domain
MEILSQFMPDVIRLILYSSVMGVIVNFGLSKYAKITSENETLKEREIKGSFAETTGQLRSALSIMEERQKFQGEVYLGKLDGVLKHLESLTSQNERRFARLEDDVSDLKKLMGRLNIKD